jgi:hypothetical protein
MKKGGTMKRLFAVAVAAGLLTSVYGASFGVGLAYNINHPPQHTYTDDFSYPAIVADFRFPLLGPFINARMGLVEYNMIADDDGGSDYHYGTGVYGDLCLTIPTLTAITPYIPIGVFYEGNGGSTLNLKAGLGGEMGVGGFLGYVEGGIKWMKVDLDWMEESESDTYFYVQGGLRVPFGFGFF